MSNWSHLSGFLWSVQSLLYAYNILWLKPPVNDIPNWQNFHIWQSNCQTFFLTAEPKKNTNTWVSIFNFVWSRYHCKELKTSETQSVTLLLKLFSKFLELAFKMKFLSVILLSLFHKNGKTNEENLQLISILGYIILLHWRINRQALKCWILEMHVVELN